MSKERKTDQAAKVRVMRTQDTPPASKTARDQWGRRAQSAADRNRHAEQQRSRGTT
jgi:hypothetical protein